MITQILSTKKYNEVIFCNSPCVITMQNWDQETQNHLPFTKALNIKNNVDVYIKDGKIFDIGENLLTKIQDQKNLEIIEAKNLVLMPGLIDCHAHPIFAGSRAQETILKSQGMSYEEIAHKGGGISSSVRSTRAATKEELTKIFQENAWQALSRGVVLLEAKTGYGLNVAEEKKLLEALYEAYNTNQNMDLPFLAPTYLAPHAESPDFRGLDNYIQALVEDIPNLSLLSQKALEKKIALPLAVDIFLERNYFSKEHAEVWLGSALTHGLDIHIHSDEFSRGGGAELAAELALKLEQTATNRRQKGRVLTVDHCQYSTEFDLRRLAKLGVSAVALPTTSFFSNISFVDAKRFRAAEIRTAIASDFNPGTAPINNLWFSCYLALSKCGFTLAEVYAGVTINAAFALGAENLYGSIEIGKKASIVAFSGKTAEDFFSSPIGDHVRYVIY